MTPEAQTVHIDGRLLRLTNLDKVVYPDSGTTKGEILAYYATIAPALLPLLRGRPVTRKRWVEGVGTATAPTEPFFAKQLERGAPPWIPRQEIHHATGAKEYPLVDDAPTLVWLAQVAAIELHVPQWRFDSAGVPANPDRLVLDIDPGPGVGLVQCAEVARFARSLLVDMGLDPVPVTSGSNGLHLYAALPGTQTSDDISAVVHELAQVIETEHPNRATSTMTKAAREGKVFLDWSQNNGKKTTISPYSLRGRAQPWVAAPRTWDELDDPALTQLSFEQVLDRFASGLDPFARFHTSTGRRASPAPISAPRGRIAASAARPTTPGSADSIAPMLAENSTAAVARRLSSPSWVEIKWDGIRAIGTWAGNTMRLQARSGTDITARYPEITADGAPFLPITDAVVDGEIVAFGDDGRPSFSLLQNRMHLTRPREIEREVVRTPISFLAFDLLRLDGHDLMHLPLSQRRTLLEEVLSDLDAPVQVPPIFDDVDAALDASRELGLEGVVVKDPASRYRPGQRSPSWLKLKLTLTQEVVIVGIRPGKGDRRGTIGSLLLAVPDWSPGSSGRLRYVGRVGTGFTDRALRDLLTRLTPLRIDAPPLSGVPAEDAADALWVRAELVGEVEFANWTPEGSLRHARWRGLRPDKLPGHVVRES